MLKKNMCYDIRYIGEIYKNIEINYMEEKSEKKGK